MNTYGNSVDEALYSLFRKKQRLITIVKLCRMKKIDIEKIALLLSYLRTPDCTDVVSTMKIIKPELSDVLDIAVENIPSVFINELKKHIYLRTEDKFLAGYDRNRMVGLDMLVYKIASDDDMYEQMKNAITKRLGSIISSPTIYDKLVKSICKPNVSLEKAAKLIEECAKFGRDTITVSGAAAVIRHLIKEKDKLIATDAPKKIEQAEKLEAAVKIFEKKMIILLPDLYKLLPPELRDDKTMPL